MAWSSEFIARLSEPDRGPLRYFVQVRDVGSSIGIPGFCVASELGLSATSAAACTALKTLGQSLTPRTWRTQIGGYEVSIVGEPDDLAEVLAAIPAGAVLELYVGWLGMARGAFARVGVGMVGGIKAEIGPIGAHSVQRGIRLQVADLPASLRSRWYKAAGGQSLFYTLGGTSARTTTTGTEAVGSLSYDVADTSTFLRRLSGTYQHGAFYVESSIGDGYWRLWSGGTSTTLTVYESATVGCLGTLDVGAGVGDYVVCGWYLRGHPSDIVCEVLTSRETGNGPWDVLPASWGLGVSVQLLDTADIVAWRDSGVTTPSSGSYQWELADREQVPDAWAWLAGLLSGGGWFLAMRQGQITVRPAQNMMAPSVHTGVLLTDADSIDGGPVDIDYAPSALRPEAYRVKVGYLAYSAGVYTPDSEVVVTTNVDTLPATAEVVYDLADRIHRNRQPVAEVDAARLVEACRDVSEVGRWRFPLWAAVLTLGDLVDLETAAPLLPRDAPRTGHRAMVVGVEVDWQTEVVTLDLWLSRGGAGAA